MISVTRRFSERVAAGGNEEDNNEENEGGRKAYTAGSNLTETTLFSCSMKKRACGGRM